MDKSGQSPPGVGMACRMLQAGSPTEELLESTAQASYNIQKGKMTKLIAKQQPGCMWYLLALESKACFNHQHFLNPDLGESTAGICIQKKAPSMYVHNVCNGGSRPLRLPARLPAQLPAHRIP